MDAPLRLIPADTAAPQPVRASVESRLAGYLMERGKLDERGLQRARRASASSDGRLADILAQLGIVSERDLAEATAEITGLPLLSREELPQEAVLIDRLSARFMREAVILPIEANETEIVVAMANPDDRFAIEAVALASGRRVVVKVAIPSELQAAIARLRTDPRTPGTTAEDRTDAEASSEVDIDRLRDLASEAPVVRFVDQLISGAVAEHASDIHIEPFEDNLRVRYRLDGRLQEVEALPATDRLAVTSRIKIMAGLNIAERRQPQDGRIRTAVDGGTLDIRVATVPTLHGESLVLRLLHRDRTALELPKLGFGGHGSGAPAARAGPAPWPAAGHRPDRQRQDHDPLCRPQPAEPYRSQDPDGRGSHRIPAPRRQSDPGQSEIRPDLRPCAALLPAP